MEFRRAAIKLRGLYISFSVPANLQESLHWGTDFFPFSIEVGEPNLFPCHPSHHTLPFKRTSLLLHVSVAI